MPSWATSVHPDRHVKQVVAVKQLPARAVGGARYCDGPAGEHRHGVAHDSGQARSVQPDHPETMTMRVRSVILPARTRQLDSIGLRVGQMH